MIEGETLGAATIEVPAAGRLTTSIPIFGPTKTVGAELVASWPSGDRAPIVGRRHARLEIRQALFLAPAGPIGLWSARVTGDTCGQVVANGFAPLDDRELTIRLIDRTGVMVAKTTAAVATNLGIAGAVAGTGLGFGSYVASLRPVRQLAGGGYRLEIDWHGPLEGDWGTSTFLVWIDRGALRDPNVAC